MRGSTVHGVRIMCVGSDDYLEVPTYLPYLRLCFSLFYFFGEGIG